MGRWRGGELRGWRECEEEMKRVWHVSLTMIAIDGKITWRHPGCVIV
jgi:hypothetical protein